MVSVGQAKVPVSMLSNHLTHPTHLYMPTSPHSPQQNPTIIQHADLPSVQKDANWRNSDLNFERSDWLQKPKTAGGGVGAQMMRGEFLGVSAGCGGGGRVSKSRERETSVPLSVEVIG